MGAKMALPDVDRHIHTKSTTAKPSPTLPHGRHSQALVADHQQEGPLSSYRLWNDRMEMENGGRVQCDWSPCKTQK